MASLDELALQYVLANGSSWEKWRAHRLLGFKEPLPQDWIDQQNPDGGWRSREMKSNLSNMGTTSVTLMRMAFLGLDEETPQVKRTLEFLWKHQQPDGRWTEDKGQFDANPPEWNKPGDLNVDLWETANTSASLAALGFAIDSRVEKAISWVNTHQREDGSYPGYLHTTYAMAALRWMRGEIDIAEHHLQASLGFLSKFGSEEWFDTMDLVWPLMLWSLVSIGRGNKTVSAYLDALELRRNSDGTWPTRYKGFEPQFTIEALEIRRAFQS